MNCNPIPNLGPVSQNPCNVLHPKSNIQIACITGALWAKWGERDILCEAWNEGRRKIERLLPVHCSGSSHVHYMSIAFPLVNWWRVVLHVCLASLSGTKKPSCIHVLLMMLFEKPFQKTRLIGSWPWNLFEQHISPLFFLSAGLDIAKL